LLSSGAGTSEAIGHLRYGYPFSGALGSFISTRHTTLKIQIDLQNLATWLSAQQEDINTSPLTFTTPFKAKRRCGVQTKIIIGSPPKEIDTTLLKNIAKAITYYDLIKKGKTYREIAEMKNTNRQRIQAVINLAFLPKETIREIMRGEQDPKLTSVLAP